MIRVALALALVGSSVPASAAPASFTATITPVDPLRAAPAMKVSRGEALPPPPGIDSAPPRRPAASPAFAPVRARARPIPVPTPSPAGIQVKDSGGFCLIHFPDDGNGDPRLSR